MMCVIQKLARKRELTWNSKGSAGWDFKLNTKDSLWISNSKQRMVLYKCFRMKKKNTSQVVNWSLKYVFHHRKTRLIGMFLIKIFELDFPLCILCFQWFKFWLFGTQFMSTKKMLFQRVWYGDSEEGFFSFLLGSSGWTKN